ncbi:sensor domain-containing diguanylate cyclase [Undibacterium sp. Jales W-56]|uniref:diguanylate cyclase n=1 Tax=Undibacterium sp. Jales W-56 TaxID=2897325 RepID=UPI0021D28972|nr:diguanylate cyclase [Undibacterium sp. Jales W-56]MCU6432719.1 sensor domain-containing diguanylate cyclase [Undibacterium sp. Jales W-56]
MSWMTGIQAFATEMAMPVAAGATQAALQLRDANPAVDAWSAVSIMPDPAGKLSVDEVIADQSQFVRPKTAADTLGLRRDVVWLRIPLAVSSASDGLWVLDIDYAVLNKIDVYLTQNKQQIQHSLLGNMQAYSKRPITSRSHALGLKLKPDSDYTLYLRVETVGAMIVPISLSKPSNFHARALNEQMLQGMMTGLALCLLIYSLAQWLSLGEYLFLKYAVLLTGSLMFSLLQFGVGAQYVWTENVWMELHAGGLSALIAACGSFLFIEQALAGRDRHRYFGIMMKGGACLTMVFAALYSFDMIDIHIVTAIISTLGMTPVLMGMPGAIARARRGDTVGGYFLSAWVVYFVTTAILIGVIKGGIPANFWTLHSFQFGATFDMLVFMRVLGLRTKALHTAAQDATRERDTLHSMAHTDPLTGLPNRRGLNTSLNTMLPKASADNILAVYMLDLDGFKQVNDQYGHDIGDELLIAVAQRLQANLRSADLVSRLGGDEFVVMSMGVNNVQQAHELGHKLLDAFSMPFKLREQICSVGLTIGYALAPHDGHDTISLLKRADAAMYSGKQSGKHCLRRGEASETLA